MVSEFVCYYLIVVIQIIFGGGLKKSDNFCESCGMPMGNTDEMYGSNANGSKNEDYCKYCLKTVHFQVIAQWMKSLSFVFPTWLWLIRL